MSDYSRKKYITEQDFFKVLLTETTYKADSTVESYLNDWVSIILKSQSQTKFEYFWRGLLDISRQMAFVMARTMDSQRASRTLRLWSGYGMRNVKVHLQPLRWNRLCSYLPSPVSHPRATTDRLVSGQREN